MLQWEALDRNSFAVFLRDLCEGRDINLKHMIEDIDKKPCIDMNINKKKKMKKKDIIIMEQEKKRILKKLEDEKKMINYMIDTVNERTIYANLNNLTLSESKLLYKCKLMKLFRDNMKSGDNSNNNDLFNIYYDLSNRYDELDEEYKKIVDKLKKTLSKYDTKSYMLEHLGHLMPPLNVWDKPKLELEKWQIEVIRKVKNRKSILIKAPTSSGKTFIAMSTGIFHKKVLYVCPAKPVAYQVGANYIKMGYKVHFLVNNCDNIGYDNSTNIFVGIPENIEDNLPKLLSSCNFDYVVYDEIHTSGDIKEYENIIKMMQVPFLGLSATVSNIDKLRNLLEKYSINSLEYVEYDKRFINQQKWIFNNGKIEKLDPFVCYDKNDNSSIRNVSFTPYDCYNTYMKLEDIFEEEVEELEPDEYFKKEKMITLDEVKEYERLLKDKVIDLQQRYPEKINKLVKKNNVVEEVVDNTIIDVLFECKKNNLLPALYFLVDEKYTKELFKKLYVDLENRERDWYPYHYDILEKKDKEYEESRTRLDIYKSSIKIKTKDAHTEILSKMENFKRKELINYRDKIHDYYNQCIDKCKKSYQKKYLKEELREFLKSPDYRKQDIYRKHHNVSFVNREPMSAEDIKMIRKELKDSVGINISYTSELFQLLKRGVGIYIESMPDRYNWIVQRLISEKKLGVVITDRTLCLGIDLPIRTAILSGYKDTEYTINDYLQMSGRAGRRGHDNQGNIIFHGVHNYIELMRNNYPDINFSDKSYDNYSIINNRYLKTENVYNNICKKFINKNNNKLLWLLRYLDSYKWIANLDKYEKDIFLNKSLKEEYMIKKLEELMGIDILKDYNENIVSDNTREVGEVVKKIYNTISKTEYLLITSSLLTIFEKYKDMLFRHQLELS